MKRRIRNISIALIVVALIAFLVVPKILSDKNKDNTGGRQGSQDQVMPVDAHIAKYGELDNAVRTVGTIMANEEVEIRSELPRKITGIYFSEGSYVQKGKLLFKLDDSDLIAQLRKLELDEELQTKQAERESQLIDKGLLTQEEYDIRLTNIEKIRADIELVNINLEKTNITAPFSGIAGFRNVSNGSFVNNTVVLTSIKDIGRVKVDFSIPERYISLFSKGQEIRFKVEGYDDEFTGTIVSYNPQINEGTRSLLLRAVAGNRGNKLLPGSFVKVELVFDRNASALMVPSESIIPNATGHSVYLYQGGKAVLREVNIGTRTEKDVLVTSGISEGDTLITTNILKLKNDSKVKIVSLN